MLKKTKQFKLDPKDTGWKFTWINITTTIASKFDTKGKDNDKHVEY